MKLNKNFQVDYGYGRNAVKWVKHHLKMLKATFVLLNMFILIAALTTSVFAIFITAYLGTQLPFWYPYVTAAIGSFTTFTSSLINFFIVREKIKTYQISFNRIWVEINKYESKLVDKYKTKEKDWHLFVAIEAILGNEAAKVEVKNG